MYPLVALCEVEAVAWGALEGELGVMYTYITYIHTCIHTYTYIHTYTHTYIHIYTHIHTCIHTSVDAKHHGASLSER